eukprot:TRINITY_DN23354_c0_g2_i1.p1 TRINITY_DN23354_c0_g2~~TRINITY_DN23354_c0_g2_i1.p1  ORF type:complete len:717 (+),score=205.76 TRINITY_DN23354_c0_g2_i1:89-2239(+)
MAAGKDASLGYKLVRKLVRLEVPAQSIRARINKVLQEHSRQGVNAIVAPADPRSQLIGEGFAELRYRTLLKAMSRDMPRFPLAGTGPGSDDAPESDDEFLGDGGDGGLPRRPPVPQICVSDMPPRTAGRQMDFPVPTMPRRPAGDSSGGIPLPGESRGPVRQGKLAGLFSWLRAMSARERQAGAAAARRRPRTEPRRLPQLVTDRAAAEEAAGGARAASEGPGNALVPVPLAEEKGLADLSPLEVRWYVSRLLRDITEMLSSAANPAAEAEAVYKANLAADRAVRVFTQAHRESEHPSLVPILNVRAFTALIRGDLQGCERDLQALRTLLDGYDCTSVDFTAFAFDPLRFQPRREKAVMLSTKTRYLLRCGDLEGVVKTAREALLYFGDEAQHTGGATIRLMLAHALSRLDKQDEADIEFKAALLQLYEQHRDETDQVVPYLQMMAFSSMHRGRHNEAKVFSSIAYHKLHSKYGNLHPRTMYGMQQVAEAYLRSKQYDVATAWLVDLNRLYLEHLTHFGRTPAELQHARALHYLCLAYLGLGKAQDAFKVAHQSLRIYERIYPKESEQLREPLLAWVTAFRMARMHAVPGGTRVAISVLNKVLPLTTASERENGGGASAEVCFILAQLCEFHLWEGNLGEAVARLTELTARLRDLDQDDRSLLAPQVAEIIAVCCQHSPARTNWAGVPPARDDALVAMTYSGVMATAAGAALQMFG